MKHQTEENLRRIERQYTNKDTRTKSELALCRSAIADAESALERLSEVQEELNDGPESTGSFRTSEKSEAYSEAVAEVDEAMTRLLLVVNVIEGTEKPKEANFKTLDKLLLESKNPEETLKENQ